MILGRLSAFEYWWRRLNAFLKRFYPRGAATTGVFGRMQSDSKVELQGVRRWNAAARPRLQQTANSRVRPRRTGRQLLCESECLTLDLVCRDDMAHDAKLSRDSSGKFFAQHRIARGERRARPGCKTLDRTRKRGRPYRSFDTEELGILCSNNQITRQDKLEAPAIGSPAYCAYGGNLQCFKSRGRTDAPLRRMFGMNLRRG